MDIGARDKIMMKLNDQLNVLSNYKMERTRELQEKVNDNKFLEKVVQNYKSYDNKFANMKREHKQQMEYLLSYLEKSMAEAKLTESMIERAKQEKENLIRQIERIDNEITTLEMK